MSTTRFHEAEGDLVEGVLRLGDRRIGGMMLPRNDIVWFDPGDSPQQLRRKITESGHSRFPVASRSLDDVLGVVHVKDLLVHALGGETVDVRTAMRSPLVVPEHTRVLQVLELFKQTRSPLALVVDEYGVVQGLVTLHDLLEAVAGDLPAADEPTHREPKVVQRKDGSWEVDGSLPMGELQEIVALDELPSDERGAYHTVSGLIMMRLGRMPTVGDRFEWADLRFEVVEMDQHRVDKVVIARVRGDALGRSAKAEDGALD